MYFEDDEPVFLGHDIDYTEIDRRNEERGQFLDECFWFLTDSERYEILPKMDGYPGDHADYDALRAYAATMRHDYARRVPCKFDLGFVTLSGKFDLIGGHAYIIEDGRYKMAEELNGQIGIEFVGKKPVRIYHAEMFYGTATKLDRYDVSPVMRELEEAKKLPQLRKI